MIFDRCSRLLFEKNYGHFQPQKKTLAAREIANLPPRAEICISKNMALIYYDFGRRPCFQFFDFCISHANLLFHPKGVAMKKWFFHHFFCLYPHSLTMTKTENRDFAFIFLRKDPINIFSRVNNLELVIVAMKIHLPLAQQMLSSESQRRMAFMLYLYLYIQLNFLYVILPLIDTIIKFDFGGPSDYCNESQRSRLSFIRSRRVAYDLMDAELVLEMYSEFCRIRSALSKSFQSLLGSGDP